MDGFSRLMVYDVFSLKDGPFGITTISEFIWGNIPQNSQKIGGQVKPAEYKNCDISQSINTINVQF